MYKHFFKPIFDFLLALISLLILSPFLIPVCIILLLTGEHEVFYYQQRIGYKNSHIRIWKFVTMLKNSSKTGTGSLTVRNDPRVLPFGKYLRKTKINELPQIINVLFGSMSFVGPRPQMEVDFYKFSEHVQEVIYDTPPGITGIGSIIFSDEEKWITNAVGDKHEYYREHIAPYKGELELWYQKHITFYTDMLLIFLTAWKIIVPESRLAYTIFSDLPERPEELR